MEEGSSSTGIRKGLRSDKIYVLGDTINEILGSKLPSKKDVLQLLLHHIISSKMEPYVAAKKTVDAVLWFWSGAAIPTMEHHNAAKKIVKLYESWKSLEKASKNRLQKDTELFKNRELNFIDELNDLFDIASNDLSEASEESKLLLVQQRMKGRPGNILFKHLTTDKEIEEDLHQISLTASASGTLHSSSDTSASLASHTTSDPDFDISEYDKSTVPIPPVTLNKRFITKRVVGELDRYKVSDYAAVHIFVSVLLGLGLDPKKFTCSRSSIQAYRSKQRRAIGEEIKQTFISTNRKGTTVHWDGKQMENILSKEKQERLPVKITHEGSDHLLGVPEIEDGTGYNIAANVYSLLVEWNQVGNVQACCYDTTSSNTGCREGAAVHLEEMLGRSLLNTPCRHHIAEILLKAAFEIKVAKSTGPDVTMFKTFQQDWNRLNLDRYKSGMRDRYVKNQLKDENLILKKIWITQQLAKKICRHDYREFLELCLLFLGDTLPRSESRHVTFRAPGAVHHARWMAKAIYSLKMFMFREQIELSEQERVGLADICVFLIRFYLTYWFRCVKAIEAPLQDLTFLRNIYVTRDTDSKLHNEIIRKFINHLWYLSEENVGFSFFDKKVSEVEKREMVARLKHVTECEPVKRVVVTYTEKHIQQFIEYNISDFVTSNTMKFFERFDISTEFLEHDPATWMEREDYKESRKRLKMVKVVNDSAERGVKLMSDYNNILSKNEEEKQWILLVVSKFREMYKSHHKKDLLLDSE